MDPPNQRRTVTPSQPAPPMSTRMANNPATHIGTYPSGSGPVGLEVSPHGPHKCSRSVLRPLVRLARIACYWLESQARDTGSRT
jgi:hypothetical protein